MPAGEIPFVRLRACFVPPPLKITPPPAPSSPNKSALARGDEGASSLVERRCFASAGPPSVEGDLGPGHPLSLAVNPRGSAGGYLLGEFVVLGPGGGYGKR